MNRSREAATSLDLFQALCIEPPKERNLQSFAGLHCQGRSLQSTLAKTVTEQAEQARSQNMVSRQTTAQAEQPRETTARVQ